MKPRNLRVDHSSWRSAVLQPMLDRFPSRAFTVGRHSSHAVQAHRNHALNSVASISFLLLFGGEQRGEACGDHFVQ